MHTCKGVLKIHSSTHFLKSHQMTKHDSLSGQGHFSTPNIYI